MSTPDHFVPPTDAATPAPEPEQPQETRLVWSLPLVCPHGHLWESELLTNRAGRPVLAWDGPTFMERFCPECCRAGKRVPITADDLANIVTDDQLREIGEDAAPALAVILAAILSAPDKSARLHIQTIAEQVVDRTERVRGYIARLAHGGFIVLRTEAFNPEVADYTLGPAVKIVHLDGDGTC